tara:strand:- start:1937 stop:2296 length:360 start_codon:yes stop_codon:yes gene_type:complete
MQISTERLRQIIKEELQKANLNEKKKDCTLEATDAVNKKVREILERKITREEKEKKLLKVYNTVMTSPTFKCSEHSKVVKPIEAALASLEKDHAGAPPKEAEGALEEEYEIQEDIFQEQ